MCARHVSLILLHPLLYPMGALYSAINSAHLWVQEWSCTWKNNNSEVVFDQCKWWIWHHIINRVSVFAMHKLLHMPLIQWLFYFIFASFGCLDSYKTGLSKPLLCSLTRMVPMDQLHDTTAIWWLSGVAAVSVACMRVQWVFLWFQCEHVFLLSHDTLLASGAVGASMNAQGNCCIQCLPVSRWPRMTHSLGISMSTNFSAFLSSATRTLMVQVPPFDGSESSPEI